jgi:hypothetical protein
MYKNGSDSIVIVGTSSFEHHLLGGWRAFVAANSLLWAEEQNRKVLKK